MAEMSCGTYRWHDVDGFYRLYGEHAEGMGDMGFCRRFPPLPDFSMLLHPKAQDAARDEVMVFAIWPETQADEWCGEWQAQDAG